MKDYLINGGYGFRGKLEVIFNDDDFIIILKVKLEKWLGSREIKGRYLIS